MENRGKRFCYFRLTLYGLIESEPILIILTILDYLTVYSNIFLIISKLIDTNDIESSHPIFYLSPFNIYKHYVGKIILPSIILIIISFLLLLFYIGFVNYLNDVNIDPIRRAQRIFNHIVVNFYELFVLRLFSIFFSDSIISLFISYAVGNNNLSTNGGNIALLCVFLLYFFVYFFWFLTSIRFNCIWSNFLFIDSAFKTFPYDMIYSTKFDSILLSIKILISIRTNVINLVEPSYFSQSVEFYISVLFLIVLLGGFFHLIYDFYIQVNNFLYYQFNKTNMVRIFLTTFAGISIIIKFLLYHNYNYIVYPMVVLSFIGLILLFYFRFMEHLIDRMIKSKDYIGVLVFLISNKLDMKKCICQWLIYHRLYCKNTFCTICQKLSVSSQAINNPTPNAKIEYGNFNKISIAQFLPLLRDETVYQMRNKKGMKAHGIFYIECMELIDYFVARKSQRIIFYVCFYRALKKYIKLNPLYYNNLLIMFDYIKKHNAVFLNSYTLFKHTENLIHLLNEFIDDFENFIHYSIKSPDNVIKIAENYNTLIKNQEAIKFFPQSLQIDNYQLVLLRFVYEQIIKNVLPNGHDYDITTLYDLLDNHFKKDQIIYIKYSFKANSSYIIKAGGVIKPHTNKPFEAIFPNMLKLYGLNSFVEQVYQNNFKDPKNVFEFIIKNTTEGYNQFVESFQMKYDIYPAIETDEMIIAGSFMISYQEVLIFEKTGNREFLLHSYSKQLEYYFGISPAIIQSLKINGKTFSFNQLFKKKNFKNKEDDDSKELFYAFQLGTYVSMLNDYNDEANEEGDDIFEKINEIRQLATSMTNEKIFQLEEKNTIIVENSTYVIYFLKSEAKIEKEINEEQVTVIVDNTTQNQAYNFHGAAFDTASMSCTSSVSSNSTRFYAKINTKKVSSIEKKGLRTINIFVRIIVIFNLLLVLLCFLFLGLEINYDQKFQTLFFLFQKYKTFKLGMEIQPLRIFSNLCFAIHVNQTDDNCYNIYAFYSRSIKTNNTIMKNEPLISHVVINELGGGSESIKNSFTAFQNDIYTLNMKETNQIWEAKSLMLTLVTGTDNKVDVMQTNYSFFEAVNLYQSYFYQIINDAKLETTSIRFLSLNPETLQIDPNSLDITKVTPEQKNIYQVVLNYPFLQRSLEKCENLIETGFENYLNTIEKILIVFTVILLSLHCVLVFICFQFIKNFKKVIHEDYCKVIFIISSPLYITYITNEISSLRTLLQFYDDKPSVVTTNMFKNQDNYKKDKKDELKTIQQTPGVIMPNLHLDNNKIYDPIVSVFQRILFITFIAYIIFYVIIFTVLFIVLKDLKYLVEYTSINAEIDNYIYDNLNGNQFILIANLTGYELSDIVYHNNSVHYIHEGIAKLYDSIERLQQFQANHPNFKQINDIINTTCDNFHQLKDPIMESAEAQLGLNLSSFMNGICNITPIMGYGMEVIVQKDIAYSMKKLANYPTKITHEETIEYMRNLLIYDLYNVVMILNRLLRTFVNDQMLPFEVELISNRFRSSVIICLVMNSVVEIMIVIILLYFVMRKMIEMNSVFMQFMKFLE